MLDDLYSEPRPVAQQEISGGRLRPVHTSKAIAPMTGQVVKGHTGPEESWSFFHPSRVDTRFAPADFRAEVHGIDPQLDVCWHHVHERWCVWVKNPRIQHWMCPGWQLLFPVKYPDGSYLPLDTRVLAEIVNRSPRKWGNGRRYFDRILTEINRDRRQRKTAHQDVVGQNARDRWDYAQIKVGYGPSNGSKFQQHHSGN